MESPRLADGAATTSIVTASFVWLDTANDIVQLIAGLAAIISGVAAAWFYISKTLDRKKLSKSDEDAEY